VCLVAEEIGTSPEGKDDGDSARTRLPDDELAANVWYAIRTGRREPRRIVRVRVTRRRWRSVVVGEDGQPAGAYAQTRDCAVRPGR
jgi:hypothetical protein